MTHAETALQPDRVVLGTMTDSGATPEQIEAAYRAGYHRFARVARAITGHADTADDAVHDAFAEALRTRGAYRGTPEGLEAWLWRAVVNRARNQRRFARLRRDRHRPLGDHPTDAAAIGDPAVRALVARLPERQRTALFLRYYADLDYEAIATALGVRRGTVASTLHDAHAALRRLMEDAR